MARSNPDSIGASLRKWSGRFVLVVSVLCFVPFALLLLVVPFAGPHARVVRLLVQQLTIVMVVLWLLFVPYGIAIAGRIGSEVRAVLATDDSPQTPVLSAIEVLAFAFLVVGFGLVVTFFGPAWDGCAHYNTGCENAVGEPAKPWISSPAVRLLGVYSPLPWVLGSIAYFAAGPMLAVARFAEAFAFTGDRSDQASDRRRIP